ncbi:DUF2267 domain-containing protein [Streptomyces sp. NPDC096079]|uniref:DUF2267 domain-containing protein n=1 Tax=Streptomyces sp. NPDC096079 TaxID=3155820 RepID=UPI0033286D81
MADDLRRAAFLGGVKGHGAYDTAEEAERASRMMPALLGTHQPGWIGDQLAADLPEGFALTLANTPQSAERSPPERFVRAAAARRVGATDQTANGDVSAVLSTAEPADEELTAQFVLRFPAGHDLPWAPSPSDDDRQCRARRSHGS